MCCACCSYTVLTSRILGAKQSTLWRGTFISAVCLLLLVFFSTHCLVRHMHDEKISKHLNICSPFWTGRPWFTQRCRCAWANDRGVGLATFVHCVCCNSFHLVLLTRASYTPQQSIKYCLIWVRPLQGKQGVFRRRSIPLNIRLFYNPLFEDFSGIYRLGPVWWLLIMLNGSTDQAC